jgi:hypothetical protein
MSENNQGPSGAAFLFHLKREAADDTRKPTVSTGTLYLTLCGHWVYDSIASDTDCPDRWVTCQSCAKLDPHPEFCSSQAPRFG